MGVLRHAQALADGACLATAAEVACPPRRLADARQIHVAQVTRPGRSSQARQWDMDGPGKELAVTRAHVQPRTVLASPRRAAQATRRAAVRGCAGRRHTEGGALSHM
jgi:hypothetical protein